MSSICWLLCFYYHCPNHIIGMVFKRKKTFTLLFVTVCIFLITTFTSKYACFYSIQNKNSVLNVMCVISPNVGRVFREEWLQNSPSAPIAILAESRKCVRQIGVNAREDRRWWALRYTRRWVYENIVLKSGALSLDESGACGEKLWNCNVAQVYNLAVQLIR